MAQTMLERKMEETRPLLRKNKDELTTPVVQSKLNKEHSVEGNCSRLIKQTKPHIREDNIEVDVDKDGCKYRDFMASQPPSLFRRPTLVAVMVWVYKMEMSFKSYNYSDK